MCDIADISWLMAKMPWPASAAGQCARIGKSSLETLAIALELSFLPLPEIICRSLCSSTYRCGKKASKFAGHFVWKKCRRLDVEDITPTADDADKSNVDDRQRASEAAESVINDNLVVVQIDIWSIRIPMYGHEFLCTADFQIIIWIWRAINIKFGHAQFRKIESCYDQMSKIFWEGLGVGSVERVSRRDTPRPLAPSPAPLRPRFWTPSITNFWLRHCLQG